ncbi:MAG: hypothetical protein AAF570_23060, partial [Bacteroidota bacterium]
MKKWRQSGSKPAFTSHAWDAFQELFSVFLKTLNRDHCAPVQGDFVLETKSRSSCGFERKDFGFLRF